MADPVAVAAPRRTVEPAHVEAVGAVALGGAALAGTISLQRAALRGQRLCGPITLVTRGICVSPDGAGQLAMRSTGLGLVMASGAWAGAAWGKRRTHRTTEQQQSLAIVVGGKLLLATVIWLPIVHDWKLSKPCRTHRCHQRRQANVFIAKNALAVMGALGAGLIAAPLVSRRRRRAQMSLRFRPGIAALEVSGRF